MSSAKRLIFSRGNRKGRSLINNRNKSGPSIEPCGTPDVMGRASEKVPLIFNTLFYQSCWRYTKPGQKTENCIFPASGTAKVVGIKNFTLLLG